MSATTTTCSLWREFVYPRSQLCLNTVLAAGQSFRWKKNGAGEWVGVMAGLVWKLRQTEEAIFYHVYGPEIASSKPENSSHRSPEISEGSKLQAVEVSAGAISSRVKQELDSSKGQLTYQSSKMKSALKLCNKPAVKLECFEDSDRVKILKYDEPPDEGLKVFNCKDLQDKEMRERNFNKFQGEGMEMVVNDEIKAEEVNNNKLQLPKPHRNGSRKSKRVIERMTEVDKKWENNTDSFEASADKNLHLRKSNFTEAKKVVGTSSAAQENPLCPIIKTEDIDRSSRDDPHHKLLEDYFQTSVDLDHLYKYWSSKDPHFQKVAEHFQGVRLLRMDPTECLLSFVCSSNNHISRISSMVEKLCTYYGKLITSIDGIAYYTFPHLSDLCGDHVESHLRELGFGYRAKFIASIAKHVTRDKGDGWLDLLRESPYLEAKRELLALLGVGAKVADCVCLMSLDKPEALPVDTHVWQFTIKNYLPKLHSAKSLTDKLYTEIGDFYRDLWGPYAGWAQAVLFAAALRHNKDKVPEKEGSSLKRKVCTDAGSRGPKTSKPQGKDKPKAGRQGKRTNMQ